MSFPKKTPALIGPLSATEGPDGRAGYGTREDSCPDFDAQFIDGVLSYGRFENIALTNVEHDLGIATQNSAQALIWENWTSPRARPFYALIRGSRLIWMGENFHPAKINGITSWDTVRTGGSKVARIAKTYAQMRSELVATAHKRIGNKNTPSVSNGF